MNTTLRITAALALSLAAGTALGQADKPMREKTDERQVQLRDQGMIDLHRGSVLIGKDVANPNDEVVATIEDFIFDRGSGRIEHAVLKSGAVLGVGGKSIAVPYARLRFDAAEERFELDMTKEQIDRAVAFVPENWSELETTTWTDQLDRWWYGEGDEQGIDAEDARIVKTGTREKITGTIRSVDRSQSGVRGERVAVTVQTEDGRTESLILGPSWYVMGHDAAPMRGDRIEADTVLTAGAERGRRVVVSAKIDGDTLVLRDSDGKTRWRIEGEDGQDTDTAARTPAARRTGRLAMLSDLIGADASAIDKTGGEVQDVVIERTSGQIALIGFDPNDNVLGIADEIKAVPWPVVSIGGDQKVRLDATADSLTAAEKLADDLVIYESAGRMNSIYSAFSVSPVKFRPREREEASRPMGDGWGKDGEFAKLFKNGTESTVTGRVTSVKTESLDKGIPSARVLMVATENGEQAVILGPEWYVKRQTLNIEDGARVTISGKRAKLGDKEYVCAHSIEVDGRSLTLWESDEPKWNGR